ncbi:hypothetical protein [Flavobacterium sp.]|jgi:hypothetical protein|uniref:hypothetical protein n=1 Tax=Flavobacterium sp. TaxID=239 RepID=UPI0037C11124
MNQIEIDLLFNQVIQQRGIYNKLEGVTENMIYNWRKGRGKKPSIGDMLGVLWQLNLIKITEVTKSESKFSNLGE